MSPTASAPRAPRFGRTSPPDTPYRAAQDLWDRRMGSALAHARTWRLAAFSGFALSGLATAAALVLALRPAAIPFVIEAAENGETRLIGPATGSYEPSDAQIAWHLARFIDLVRAMPSDPVVVRRNWLKAYDFATQAGAQALNAMARSDDPFARIGKTTVAVDVLSVVRASPASFQLRWRETTYASGALIKTERFTGVASILIEPPATPEGLAKNPLGLFVHSLTWSQDLQP